MTLIDKHGRVAGVVNVVDAAAVLAAVALVLLAALGYALFRMPAAPAIESVAPVTVTEGTNARVRVTGRDLLPFFRVFLERSGGPPTLSHRVRADEPSDEFTVSNRAQARFVVESPTLAEVWIPEGTLPGTYTIALYDETRRVAMKEHAVEVQPASMGTAPRSVTVRAIGTFTGLPAEAMALIKPGARLPLSAKAPLIEVLEVGGSGADRMRLQVGRTFALATVADRTQVAATLRLFCVPFDGRCRIGAAYPAALTELPIDTGRGAARFFVHDITPDEPAAFVAGSVVVRVVTARPVAERLHVGDEEQSPVSGMPSMAPLVVIAALHPVRDSNDGLVWRDVAFTVPLVKTGDRILFRGEALKPGSTFTFITADYRLQGTVVAIRLNGEGV